MSESNTAYDVSTAQSDAQTLLALYNKKPYDPASQLGQAYNDILAHLEATAGPGWDEVDMWHIFEDHAADNAETREKKQVISRQALSAMLTWAQSLLKAHGADGPAACPTCNEAAFAVETLRKATVAGTRLNRPLPSFDNTWGSLEEWQNSLNEVRRTNCALEAWVPLMHLNLLDDVTRMHHPSLSLETNALRRKMANQKSASVKTELGILVDAIKAKHTTGNRLTCNTCWDIMSAARHTAADLGIREHLIGMTSASLCEVAQLSCDLAHGTTTHEAHAAYMAKVMKEVYSDGSIQKSVQDCVQGIEAALGALQLA
ncbi:hypothetical protein Q5752_002735 [Cryptotrichosporon argae]